MSKLNPRSSRSRSRSRSKLNPSKSRSRSPSRSKLNPSAKKFKPKSRSRSSSRKKHRLNPLAKEFKYSPNRDVKVWTNPKTGQKILFTHTAKNIPKSFYK